MLKSLINTIFNDVAAAERPNQNVTVAVRLGPSQNVTAATFRLGLSQISTRAAAVATIELNHLVTVVVEGSAKHSENLDLLDLTSCHRSWQTWSLVYPRPEDKP